MWIAGIVLIALGVGLIFGYRSQKKKFEIIEATQTATVEFLRTLAASMIEDMGRGSFIYKTEVKGKVECSDPLISELAQAECVYYSMRISRDYEETYWDRDQQGHQVRRTRRGSDIVAQNERFIPFFINDGTGKVKIEPAGAEFISEKALSQFEPAESGGRRSISIGKFKIDLPAVQMTGDRRTLGYSMEETIIPVGRELYILGEATDVQDDVIIQKPRSEGRFIISTKREEELIRESKSSMTFFMVGAIASFVIGVALIVIDLLTK